MLAGISEKEKIDHNHDGEKVPTSKKTAASNNNNRRFIETGENCVTRENHRDILMLYNVGT